MYSCSSADKGYLLLDHSMYYYYQYTVHLVYIILIDVCDTYTVQTFTHGRCCEHFKLHCILFSFVLLRNLFNIIIIYVQLADITIIHT